MNHFQLLRAEDFTLSGAYSDEKDENEEPNGEDDVDGSPTNSIEDVGVDGIASKAPSTFADAG